MMAQETFQVFRDGKPVSDVFDNENDAYAWLHHHQNMSVDWALKYEGYSIRKRDDTHGYTAIISTSPSVVPGSFCDVSVVENEDVGIPGNTVVMEPVATSVQVFGDWQEAHLSIERIKTDADKLLAENGWLRTEAWSIVDDAFYASVKRSS